MDPSADSETPTPHTTVRVGPSLEQELSLEEGGGNIILQLLEFKTHLLEAVEELHIRKDAETRFEDQISKLLLEKQGLEWEKESLQHQIETVTNQRTESLTSVKRQFQAKIRNIEEQKGKYQVSAELKDKEINNLKEELRSLQLLKNNLEKKSNELEQKLALQSRSKDSHLNQLGEVEKRFSALSRKCAMVKQAHEKLEQNVDEAMRINKNLTSENEKQEATIISLKKELEEVRNKLIKAKMTPVRHDKTRSHTAKEQHIQKLHQKLNMETQMNEKLREENVTVRAEKQEVMRSLQHSQQLLLTQTETVNRAELELQTLREQCQALKQKHEVMQDKSKAMEDKVAQLMNSYTASKTSWDKEKKVFLNCIKSEQQDLHAVKEAYDELHQKHTELSSLAEAQTQHISELEMRNSSQRLSVSIPVFPLNEPIPGCELPNFGSLQHLASSQTKNPDCPEDTGAVTKLVATGATGGEKVLNLHQQSQFKQPLIYTTSSVSDNNLLVNKGSCVSCTTSASSLDHRSINGSEGLLSKEKKEEGNGGMNAKKHGGKNNGEQEKNNRKEEERNTEQQGNTEAVQGENVKEGGNTGEKRGTFMAQTTDTADRLDDSHGSAEDTGDSRNPETETRDRAEGQGTDGGEEEERRKKAVHTSESPETQILAQTTTDWTTEKSNTQRVIDSMGTEPPLAVCEPSDHSQSLSQKVTEEEDDSTHVNKGCGVGSRGQFNTDSSLSVHHGPNPIIQVPNLCQDEVQTQDAESLSQLPRQIYQVSEKSTEEKSAGKSAADFPTEPSEPLSQTQTNTGPLAAHTDDTVRIQEFKMTTAQTVPSNESDITCDMKQTDEICDTHVSEECGLVRTLVEPQPLLQNLEISEQLKGQLKSVVTDDDGDSSACKKSEDQSNGDTQENYGGDTVQEPVEESNLKDVCVDMTIDTESEMESGSCQGQMKNDKIEDTRDANTTKSETDLKLSVRGIARKSSFDLASALHHFVQGSGQNSRGSAGCLRQPPGTKPMFPKSKRSKVPLVITRASDLLNASSVSGNAASSTRHQQGEWKALGETCSETTAADTESRTSPSISSFPGSTSSSMADHSWQATPGRCSRAPTSAAGPVSESDWEPSCSQEREDQQSSFRAQISKIEQFLNTERLRLPKRQRTDN